MVQNSCGSWNSLFFWAIFFFLNELHIVYINKATPREEHDKS